MKKNYHQLPILIEKDEDGFYLAECPLFSGCYTQGKSIDEALRNFNPQEFSFHTLTYA